MMHTVIVGAGPAGVRTAVSTAGVPTPRQVAVDLVQDHLVLHLDGTEALAGQTREAISAGLLEAEPFPHATRHTPHASPEHLRMNDLRQRRQGQRQPWAGAGQQVVQGAAGHDGRDPS